MHREISKIALPEEDKRAAVKIQLHRPAHLHQQRVLVVMGFAKRSTHPANPFLGIDRPSPGDAAPKRDPIRHDHSRRIGNRRIQFQPMRCSDSSRRQPPPRAAKRSPKPD
jgi:hypothetical protein